MCGWVCGVARALATIVYLQHNKPEYGRLKRSNVDLLNMRIHLQGYTGILFSLNYETPAKS